MSVWHQRNSLNGSLASTPFLATTAQITKHPLINTHSWNSPLVLILKVMSVPALTCSRPKGLSKTQPDFSPFSNPSFINLVQNGTNEEFEEFL